MDLFFLVQGQDGQKKRSGRKSDRKYCFGGFKFDWN